MRHDALAAELRSLRDRVPGITDTVLATADGLLILADAADGIDPSGLAALSAAVLGLSRRTAGATQQGSLRQTVVHSSGGSTAVYAVGGRALLIVLGDEGMDTGLLHRQTRPVVDRVDAILSAAWAEKAKDSSTPSVPEHE
ncbi:roadblock/LC7 domain-containing protein [Allokutzneria sp. NRRL B-24872]|uniref:roadblock/LC7 domain-containing protein n=1 Tax=Allokutzneria sp. NRRL B-24872 TaxID=1137961 RepID=UPI000A3A3B82|nr:roadblock/LC7 domain-containing protein [Allokutzneria sp. NRRL B-24872]